MNLKLTILKVMPLYLLLWLIDQRLLGTYLKCINDLVINFPLESKTEYISALLDIYKRRYPTATYIRHIPVSIWHRYGVFHIYDML